MACGAGRSSPPCWARNFRVPVQFISHNRCVFRRVGPEVKIRAAAEVAQIDISQFDKIYTEHSHPAAERAVLMAREHKVEALMKGSLHADELMHLSMLNTGCAPRVA